MSNYRNNTTQPLYGLWLAACMSMMLISPAVAANFDVVAATGLQVPGMEAGVSYEQLWGASNFPQFNAAGQVLLPAKISGTGVNDDNDGGLWVVDMVASTSQLVARQGDQAPGVAAGITIGTRAFVDQPPNYMSKGTGAFNDAGKFVYWADLTGPGVDLTNEVAMLTGTTAADLALLARTGDQAVGMPSGVVYSSFARYQPVMNPSGQIVLSGRVSGPGVIPTLNEDAVWTGTPGGLSLVAQQGNTAPGTTEKFALHMYTGFETLINDAGEIQVKSLLTPNGVFANNSNAGLWKGTSEANLELIAHKNDPAPGLGAGVPNMRFLDTIPPKAFRSCCRQAIS